MEGVQVSLLRTLGKPDSAVSFVSVSVPLKRKKQQHGIIKTTEKYRTQKQELSFITRPLLTHVNYTYHQIV